MFTPVSRVVRPATSYTAFVAFGVFWGVWGASVPALRDQAGLSDAQLGVALLAIGAGALPVMLLTGPALDRWGHRVTGLAVAALGLVGLLIPLTGRNLVTLVVALALVGATSGAADVGINALAGAAQRTHGGSVVLRSHAVFSSAVVVSSLAVGGLRHLDIPPVVAFALAGIVALVVATVIYRTGRSAQRNPAASATDAPPAWSWRSAVWPNVPVRRGALIVLGGLGAIGLAVENAHQSWAAVMLVDELGAGPLVAALGPATFAGVVALARLVATRIPTGQPVRLVAGSAIIAAVGTVTLALAPNVAVGLIGLAMAAAGTASLFPGLLGLLAGTVDDAVRGVATGVVTTVGYLGFIAGPVYVGFWSAGAGLPGALIAVAALALALAVLAVVVLPRLLARGTWMTRPTNPSMSAAGVSGTGSASDD